MNNLAWEENEAKVRWGSITTKYFCTCAWQHIDNDLYSSEDLSIKKKAMKRGADYIEVCLLKTISKLQDM